MAIAQFSGLASGIDSASLIDAVIAAKQIKNDLRKNEVEFITSENEAILEFKSKITALGDILDKFRTINGGGVSKKANSSDTDVATASASAAAANATYALTVTSVANTGTASFDYAVSDTEVAVSAAGGDVTVTVGLGAEQKIITKTATAGVTTLSELVTAFNADTDAAGRVVASAVNIGTATVPDYRLVFTSLESGTEKGTLALSGTTAEFVANTVQQATDSIFTLGGIGTAVTRSSATISDVITGVTFNLADLGTTTISITNDAATTADKIQEFIDSYNEIVTYMNDNNFVERSQTGTKTSNVFGTLAKATVDNDFMSAFRLAMSAATASNGTTVTKLSDLGILTNRDGTLSFNKDSSVSTVVGFTDAIASDAAGVTGVLNSFADALGGTDGVIYQYTKLGGQIDIAKTSNDNQIENISNAIAQLDRQTDKMRESLTLRFSRLESITAKMQAEQQGLTSALAALGNGN